MRLTYTKLQQQYLRNIGKAGSTDTNVLADFNLNLGRRYQLILAKMANYVTEQTMTSTTVASQQYYHYPPGMAFTDNISITIGSVTYPMTPIYDQRAWNLLNALQIQPTAIPQFYFLRRDDFGVWPIPGASTYTINLNAFMRFVNLSIDDYAVGTVAVTQNSQTVTGTNTTFTPAMVGMWFSITDPTVYGQGYWYRIATYVSATQLTLEEAYQGSAGSGVTYVVGQTPEIPPEGHIMLCDGATADFYAGFRDDQVTSQAFENLFWTGDRNNTSRVVGDNDKISSGLIGMMNRYSSRDNKRLILKQPQPFLPQYKVWSTTLSS